MQSDRLSTIKNDIGDLVGETPMLWYKPGADTSVKGKIALKLESENPMASVKDRLALGIIREAEKAGEIVPGKSVLIEATSGNTGIALAHQGIARGYRVILVMPEHMSQERRCVLKILGAELVLTPASKGMKGAVAWATKLAAETPNAYLTSQFDTKYNAKIHYETTGPEIYSQTQKNIDYFVSGVGTGGTLAGVASYLADQGSACRIIAVEPAESPVISGGKPGPHKIQGMGAGFVPKVLEEVRSKISEVVTVTSDEAMATAKALPVTNGVFCGISGGAIVAAAIQIAKRPEAEGKTIVAIIPSFGERYLTTALFDEIRQECLTLPVLDAQLFSNL